MTKVTSTGLEEPDPDDPFASAFVVVRKEKRGNLTWQEMELAPGHSGFDGDLYIVSVPELDQRRLSSSPPVLAITRPSASTE